MKTPVLVAFLVLGAGFVIPAAADDAPTHPTLALGAAAPDFALPGVDGHTHALKEYAGARALVIVFTCNHCPTAQAYEDRLLQLHADYKDRGVGLVVMGLHSSPLLGPRMGSVTYRVLCLAHRLVLALPPQTKPVHDASVADAGMRAAPVSG